MTLPAAAFLFLAAGSAAPRLPRVRRAQYRMGTVLEIDASGGDRSSVETAVAEAFSRVGAAEERLSNWRVDSELSLVNRQAAAGPFPLSAQTFWSLRRALALARDTGGAFDPTVGAVTSALGLTGTEPRPELASGLAGAVGWEKVLLDDARHTIRFGVERMEIDSGAFGKGEALDQATAALRAASIQVARLNFGGQIALMGAHTPAGHRLGFDRVAVAAPVAGGREICWFASPDGSISTSGDAEKPGHLIDPRTGQPALFHGSVTVVADTAFDADALSTALFVMGPSEGLAFANKRAIAALFIIPARRSFSLAPSAAFPRISRNAL